MTRPLLQEGWSTLHRLFKIADCRQSYLSRVEAEKPLNPAGRDELRLVLPCFQPFLCHNEPTQEGGMSPRIWVRVITIAAIAFALLQPAFTQTKGAGTINGTTGSTTGSGTTGTLPPLNTGNPNSRR